MPKLNFNVPIMGLDGKEMIDKWTQKPTMLGQVFATTLANRTKGNAIKLFTWAKDMYAGKEVEVDLSDIEILKAVVNDDEGITMVVKQPLLEMLIKASNEK